MKSAHAPLKCGEPLTAEPKLAHGCVRRASLTQVFRQFQLITGARLAFANARDCVLSKSTKTPRG